MKRIISLISVAILLTAVLSLAACKDNEPVQEAETTVTTERKSVTSEAVKISELPKDTDARLEMFNVALDYFEVYCIKYTKKVKCEVSGVNVGSLSAASNAVAAFKSIFGETEMTNEYDYNNAPESFTANIIKSGLKKDDISSAEVKREGENVVLKITFKNESNPDTEKGLLRRLSADYVGAEKIKSSLSEFGSSAGSVSASASNIVATAVISAVDSSLQKLTVSYNENFALGSVKLVQLESSSVTGSSKTVVTYTNME